MPDIPAIDRPALQPAIDQWVQSISCIDDFMLATLELCRRIDGVATPILHLGDVAYQAIIEYGKREYRPDRLNYFLSSVIWGMIERGQVFSYTRLDTIANALEQVKAQLIPLSSRTMGTLTCVFAELYRRLGAPYEDVVMSRPFPTE